MSHWHDDFNRFNFYQEQNRLVWRFKEQILWVEPWGKDSIRVRATTLAEMPLRDWSLLPAEKSLPQKFPSRQLPRDS